MDDGARRAEILLEALPYIRHFHGKTIVIKYGGAAMNKADLSREFARDVTLLQYVGMRPVIVHGGGPQVNQTLKDLNIESKFVDGLRVTDENTMDVVEMVLSGRINKQIVSLINHEGGRAVGISGKDGLLARTRKKELTRKHEDGTLETISLGRVGALKDSEINPDIINTLDGSGFIPVIAPIATDAEGHSLNINADIMAGAVASALKAEKLVLLTDTKGLLMNEKTITRLTPGEVRDLIDKEIITGGMLPKVECCLDALQAGVARTHIIDGRIPHSLLLEIFTIGGVGTLISNNIDLMNDLMDKVNRGLEL